MILSNYRQVCEKDRGLLCQTIDSTLHGNNRNRSTTSLNVNANKYLQVNYTATNTTTNTTTNTATNTTTSTTSNTTISTTTSTTSNATTIEYPKLFKSSDHVNHSHAPVEHNTSYQTPDERTPLINHFSSSPTLRAPHYIG